VQISLKKTHLNRIPKVRTSVYGLLTYDFEKAAKEGKAKEEKKKKENAWYKAEEDGPKQRKKPR
jgi:hypothetical protein